MKRPENSADVIYKDKDGNIEFGYYSESRDAIVYGLHENVVVPFDDVVAWCTLEKALDAVS